MDKLNPLPIHFVDLETTALTPVQGEIIEICILTSLDWGYTISDVYHKKVKPVHLHTANPEALQVNGYTDGDHDTEPTWAEIKNTVSDILSTGVICAHNAIFESSWLNYYCNQSITHRFMCTQTLVYAHLPLRSASMQGVRQCLGWSEEGAHTAYVDAYDVYRLFRLLLVEPTMADDETDTT